MTYTEKTMLDGVAKLADEAPDSGLCPIPFRLIHAQMLELIHERDELRGYREPKKVLEYIGYCGKCPSCGAVFLDPSTPYCGNCGQAIVFPNEKQKERR